MSEEKVITAEGAMRAALDGARVMIVYLKEYITEPVIKEQCTTAISQIDAALAMKMPDYYMSAQVQKMLRDAYNEGRHEKENEPVIQLLELPEQIKAQATAVLETQQRIENLKCQIDIVKTMHLAPILNNNKEFSNQAKRDIALEESLKNDAPYQSSIKELSEKQALVRRQQIALDFLHNSFSAYKAIAGMQGVK